MHQRNEEDTKEITQISEQKAKEIKQLKEEKKKIFIQKSKPKMANATITPKTSLIIPLSQRLNSYKSNDNMPNIK